jgi:diguanylate cyclase (GGDEF)-like protein
VYSRRTICSATLHKQPPLREKDAMTTFFQHLHRYIEKNFAFALILCGLLALPLAGALAVWHAEQWRQEHVRVVFASALHELGGRTHGRAEDVAFKFATLRNLSALLAEDALLTGALAHGKKNGARAAAHRRLKTIATRLGLSRALLLDRRGVCVASDEPTRAFNLVGVDLSDRQYVIHALRGEPHTQLVVGRISSEPGFHFSSPVVLNGKVLGVLSLKMGLLPLADQIPLPSGIIVDAMGVVVLSTGLDQLLSVIPGAPALGLSMRERRLLYKRDRLKMLAMHPVTVFGQPAFRVDTDVFPSLRQVARIPREDLTVYGFQSLKDILEETDRLYLQRLTWFFLSTYLASCLFLGSLVYAIRDQSQRRALKVLNLELAEQAQRDALTCCFNRRPFTEMIEREVQRSARSGRHFALALIDLDHFKEVNDTHGHVVGDAVLVQVAEIIQGELRQIDTFARMGGDEFAVLLPGADAHNAAEVLRRIVERFKTTPLKTPIGPLWQTLSVGVVSAKGDMTPQQMAEAADKALYESKHQGRNQVSIHKPSEEGAGSSADSSAGELGDQPL